MIQFFFLCLLIVLIVLFFYTIIKRVKTLREEEVIYSTNEWYENITFEELPEYVRIAKNNARYNQWGNGNKVRRVQKWETTGRPGLFMADIGATFFVTMEDLEPCTEEQYDATEFDAEKEWIK